MKVKIGETQIDLLRNLSNAAGVSGAEGEIRDLVIQEVKDIADEVTEDALGNLIVRKKGNGKLKVLLAAHMDEIGLMISSDDGNGLYQFEIVGGIDVRQLPGQAVLVGKKKVPGVIGARAIHLTTAKERAAAIPKGQLRIDVGQEGKVEIGDRGVFATSFWENGKTLFGKALDDRLGVATLIEMLKSAPDHLDLYFVFTTQEEIGLRGAWAAAYSIHPDVAIAIDSTPAYDFPTLTDENTTYNTQLGKGPALYTMDRATFSDPRLVKFFVGTAEKHGIPYQIRQAGGGGTDAGVMHLQHEGIPSISISVPGRNAHTAVGMVRKQDWEDLLNLVNAAINDLDEDLLHSLI